MRKRRGRIAPRAGWAAVGMITLALLATIPAAPLPRLVWNASASAPLGLYRVTPGRDLDVDDMVVAWTPLAMRRLAATRHYIPLNVPLVKRVAALEHDIVCAEGPDISINGRWVAARLATDGKGRAMPGWSGCRVLGEGELFLLIEDNPNAFDGRYFGITEPSEVIGRALLLWPR
ncbi:S26 family signal peptidase [Sphingomonas sp. UYEF23]|uniref:S26 family signal peptidase n=1 Tax=Sphingomonas sp. UYEF23 TaxID=1756408 RepID=UPI003395EA40